MIDFSYFLDLISASELLVEFQELCKILKLNPQVRKTKYVDGTAVPGNLNRFCKVGQFDFTITSILFDIVLWHTRLNTFTDYVNRKWCK